ncbi:hypothetical protein LUZ60_003516 [Juncus effusus]|nr:hypothetical protein LUZ60_003516 [Juncus effusus]
MFRSNNVAARVFERQILTPRPGTSINLFRHFYENICPTHTIHDLDAPDNAFRKFTNDGLFLISFSRNHQDLIIYRPTWLSYSCKGDCSNFCELPAKSRRFDSFFKEIYSVGLAGSGEFLCRDFFLYWEKKRIGIFATSTVQSNENDVSNEGAINGMPSIDKITFHLVRLEDGVILDEKSFCNDFINLAHGTGAFLYEDLLCILSLRYQIIHILQIRDSGNLVEVRMIGPFCQEDDQLFLQSNSQVIQGSSFLPGIKQRLLSFIFRKTWNEETDPKLRVQHLKKRFYFHFQDYVDLIIWKVQFLDRHHLLIKFGSVEGGVSRTADQNLSFFAVYNMETTEIVSFYQNSSEELYSFFERLYDYFNAVSRTSLHSQFISSYTNNIHALDQLLSMKTKSASFSQFVRKMISTLPYTCQSHSPSPYFDLSLFRYDDKMISAIDRHRHSAEHPIKFISLRQPNVVKFKIKPGPESGAVDSRQKKVSSFLFHPFLPLILSIQQTYMQPTVVNLHFRR